MSWELIVFSLVNEQADMNVQFIVQILIKSRSENN